MATQLQHTIAQSVSLAGVGVHGGLEARVRLAPAPAGCGIVFVRTDVGGAAARVTAAAANVSAVANATTITNSYGVSVGTTEHLLAACAGLGVDNLIVEIDGPELPILDGSAAPFARALLWARIVAQGAERRVLRVVKRVEVRCGDKVAALEPLSPAAAAPQFDVRVQFSHKAIGAQRLTFALTPDFFTNELCDARTFGFLRDWDKMRAAGLGLGASLENTLAFDEEGAINPEGLRHADEVVRHKALDAIGDLALAGAPVLARYVAEQPGHALNAALVQALLADSASYVVEGAAVDVAAPLVAVG